MVALGLALFLAIGGLAFWILFFLLGVVLPMWMTLGTVEMLRPKRLTDSADGRT